MDLHAAKGTKLRLSNASNGSVWNIKNAPAPMNTVRYMTLRNALLMNERTPSMSNSPRVSRSPVCMRSWYAKLSLCSFS